MSKISELLNRAIESFYKTMDTLQGHIADRGNPHGVTKEQVGLSNVSNIKAASSAEFNAHKSASVLAHPDGSVTETKLAKGAVTAAKLGDGAVTPEKIYGTVPVAKGGTGAATPEAAREALGAMSAVQGEEILNNTLKIKTADGGFSGGGSSFAGKGGAVGKEAIAGEGFAGGYRAETIGNGGTVDAIQLGTGTNWEEKTLKVYDYKLLDADGNVPAERLAKSQLIKRYGVKFRGSANSGTTVRRLYNAEGLTAIPGTDWSAGYSDFDNLMPWSGRRRCCGYFDADGNFVVNAYEGEPGYATDGSMGEVWVETPLFYYSHTYGDNDEEEICISPYYISGYLPSPAHINADGTLRQKAYTAAYLMGKVDGVFTSRSGVMPCVLSLNSAMSGVKSMGEKYRVTSVAEQYMKCLLMWVEFATRDLQQVMAGSGNLPYAGNIKVSVAQSGENSIIVSNSAGKEFVEGQSIGIGSSMGYATLVSGAVVDAIVPYDSENTRLYIDSKIDSVVGSLVFSMPWRTGACDSVQGTAGSLKSNTSGKYPCIYRGEEMPYCGGHEFLSDVMAKRVGSGTTEDPYKYELYYLPDTAKYTGKINDSYVKMSYNLGPWTGQTMKLGLDSRYPFVRLPEKMGGTTSTYYADSYVCPANDENAVATGGAVGEGSSGGPTAFYCATRTQSAIARNVMRLSYGQGKEE